MVCPNEECHCIENSFEKKMMITNRWDKIRSASAGGRMERPDDEPREMAVASISGELINAMAAASSMTKQNLILIAQWKKQEMMDELQRRNVSFNHRAKKEELFQAVIHAMI